MSNAVNFNNMPVNYGLLYAFDCNTYIDGAETWDNSVSGGKAATVVGGTIYMDGSVFFASGGNFAYWVNSESYTDSTKYFIAKALNTPSQSSYYAAFTERGASSSYTTDIDVYGSTGVITLYCNASGSSSRTSILSTDYHVIATTKSGKTACIYVDGVKYYELTGKTAFTPTNYGIGTSSTTGNIPTKSSNDLYVKCALVCHAAHSEGEILQNSNWLLEQYGLKPPEKNSRLAGTDAVAIAYAIARNQESAAALQEMKKAYKDGIKQGVKDGSESTEDFDSEGNPPICFDDDDGNEFIDDPAITDMKNGLWYSGKRPNDSSRYVIRIYIEPYYESGKASTGYDYIIKNKPKYIVYNDGTVKSQGTINVHSSSYMYSYLHYNGYYWNQSVKKIWIDGSYIKCTSHRKTVNGEWEYDDTSSTNLSLSGLTITNVSNTQPF